MSKRNRNQGDLFATHADEIKAFNLKRLRQIKADILADMAESERKALNRRRSALAKARDTESWDEVKRGCNRI